MNDEAHKQVELLFRLFRDQGLSELMVEDETIKLHLSRRSANTAPEQPVAPPPKPDSAPAEPQPREQRSTLAVRSPLIGVFYRAAAPDIPPFVEVGDTVEEGQTVCIVEAMKVFNEIKAEWRGTVVDIPVENGSLVQAGDQLVILEFLGGGGEEEEG
jgi:oxaloacetate decarboxylase alpha subunit